MADDANYIGNAMLFKHLIGNTQNVIEILTDAEHLKNCLSDIGFKVTQYQDLKADEIRDAVKMQVIAENKVKMSSEVFFVGILGAKTNHLPNNDHSNLNIWEDVVHRFGTKYCPGLQTKSKLFFIDTLLTRDSKSYIAADMEHMMVISSERDSTSSRSSKTARLRRRTGNYDLLTSNDSFTANQSGLSRSSEVGENYQGSKVVKLFCQILRNYPDKMLPHLFASWNYQCEKLGINSSIYGTLQNSFSSRSNSGTLDSTSGDSFTNLAELHATLSESEEAAKIPRHDSLISVIMIDKCVGTMTHVTDAATMTELLEDKELVELEEKTDDAATSKCNEVTEAIVNQTNEAQHSDETSTSGLKGIFNSLKLQPKRSSLKRYHSMNDTELLRNIKSVSWHQQLCAINAASNAENFERKIICSDLRISVAVDNESKENVDLSSDTDSSTDSMILNSLNDSTESISEIEDKQIKECELKELEIPSKNDPMEVIKPENEVTILPESIQACGVDSFYRLNAAVCAPFGPWTWKNDCLPIKLYLRHKSESSAWSKIDVQLQHPKKQNAWQAAICSVEATKLVYWISYRDIEEEHLVLSSLPDGRRLVSQRLLYQARRESIHVDCHDEMIWILPELVCTPIQRFSYPGLQLQKEWTYEKILSPAQLSTSADKVAILDNADQCIYVFNKNDFQLIQIVKYQHVVSSTALVLIPTSGPGAPNTESSGGLNRQPMMLALNRDRLTVWNRLGEKISDSDFLPTALKGADSMWTILHQSCGLRRYVFESIPGSEVITAVYPLEQLLKRIDSNVRNNKQKCNQINAESDCVLRSFKFEDLLESSF